MAKWDVSQVKLESPVRLLWLGAVLNLLHRSSTCLQEHQAKNHTPGDSSRDLLIPLNEGHLTFLRGHVFTIQKKGHQHAELIARLPTKKNKTKP